LKATVVTEIFKYIQKIYAMEGQEMHTNKLQNINIKIMQIKQNC